MGFESFRVALTGGSATWAEAEAVVRRHPQAKPDTLALDTPSSAYYTVDDGRHVLEVEVMPDPVTVSCRFTLCHSPSVDAAFLGILRGWMAELGMEARICDDVRPEHAHPFPIDQFPEFADLVTHYVAGRRAEWRRQFGPEQFPARTPEVFERAIIPRCMPIAEVRE